MLMCQNREWGLGVSGGQPWVWKPNSVACACLALMLSHAKFMLLAVNFDGVYRGRGEGRGYMHGSPPK